ncbi:hypothetical protein DDB_G0275485 [Dictyostelium discoideum AX4]|uniref:Putative uncharacterized protein DDB_G0275485 n=1 Tax=Dictyostelium discoideum TaxID=44689 RepID=Y7162_DICDI|nr:hypothetical protein DDB_G0275485 [Dictyostelium discoideum AX4]Q86ID5.1 RecName: Full=Putative uncharacterized protein DDB_G0275485 [Dictyostelium discoideum]EAL69493.1 hypothetical protein DDB_G0275485 [Dictyostelium discoideum AX4]|eukprot:XP_643585.1 hypothetical protein DDB_G0275485 [Dictyostelium discoideum AX4]
MSTCEITSGNCRNFPLILAVDCAIIIPNTNFIHSFLIYSLRI